MEILETRQVAAFKACIGRLKVTEYIQHRQGPLVRLPVDWGEERFFTRS